MPGARDELEPGSGQDRSVAGESGFVAGAEALVLGVLVFVFGTVVVVNAWAVIDAKFATNAAAREAVRAVVEAPAGTGATQLVQGARDAAATAVVAHGHDPARVAVTAVQLSGARCDPVEFRASTSVRATVVPGITAGRTFEVRSTHQEVVDPFRSGLDGEAACGF